MTRLKNRVSLFLCAVLAIIAVGVVPATALAAEPNGNCSNVTSLNLFAGYTMDNLNFSSVTGVKGTAYDRDGLYPCINSPATDVNLGPAYWISISPAPGNTDGAGTDAILQIGFGQCYDAFYPGAICDDGGENSKWMFYAEGGCGGAQPIVKELGLAPAGGMRLTIDRQSGGAWYMTIHDAATDVLKSSILISGTNPETSCWASGTGDEVEAGWFCERWDGNDGCGDDGNKISFINISHQNSANNGTWYTPGQSGYGDTLTDADCFESTSEDFCDTDQGNDIRLWTQQGS